MLSKLVAIVSLIVVSSWALPMLDRPANHDLSASPECSTNASAAWVDVVLLIDTSSNMGNGNLRKVSTIAALVMSKFTIGNRANISAGDHNTRVAVITYDREARIVANFTDINSLSDLSQVLNKIQVSNTAEANLYNAFEQQVKCIDPYFTNCSFPTADLDIDRPTAYVVFASNLDTNCYCKFGDGIPLVLMDKSQNRYSRYAQCMALAEVDEQELPDNYTELCTADSLTPLAILSQGEENFIQTIWEYSNFYNPPYYIGLHQDSKGNWVWYDDNMTEFSSSYFNWGPGYPMNLGKCAIADLSEDGNNLVWKDADCDPQHSQYGLALCQQGACDAESVACGLVNLPNINLTLVEKKRMAVYKLAQTKKSHKNYKKNLKVVRNMK